jgi:ribosomal-protein-alanine N-acetyltransferase
VSHVRQLARSDLHRAAKFCERARAADRDIEPFGDRLAGLADGARALLGLWQMAADDQGAIQGVAFAALRGSPRDAARKTADVYVAVAAGRRRNGLGRALCDPALQWAARESATLRARVPEGAVAGQRFLGALGFRHVDAQLLLTWSRRRIEPRADSAVAVRQLAPEEALPQLQQLSREAWAGAADEFTVDSDELARLSREQGRLTLLAETGGAAAGYLSAAWLGNALAIEEVAVMPERRRQGIGRALLSAALRDAASGVLWVADSNGAGRALYRSLGFAQSARRLVYELRHG